MSTNKISKLEQIISSILLSTIDLLNDTISKNSTNKRIKYYKAKLFRNKDNNVKNKNIQIINHLLETNKQSYSQKKISKNEKINYVAIGDSIAAGFIATLSKEYPGQLNENKLQGLSYPTYLASIFQKINRLGKFINISFTSSTIFAWNILLKSCGDSNNITKSELETLKRFFDGDNWVNYYHSLMDNLNHDCNLVTIQLGSNDLLEIFIQDFMKLDFNSIFNSLAKNNDILIIFDSVYKFIENLFRKHEDSQIELIQRIREISPNANINFISYPAAFTPIFDLVDSYMNNYSIDNNFRFSWLFFDLLNRKTKLVAMKHNVFFINPYNHDYFVSNYNKVIDSIFDVHPGPRGYKKIAQDLFIKLTSESKIHKVYLNNNINWSTEFLEYDNDSYLAQIELDGDCFEIYRKIFGENIDEYINDDDEFIKEIYYQNTSFENYFIHVLDHIKLESIIFSGLLPIFLSSKIYKKLDPKGELKEFLIKNNNENINKIKNFIHENKILPHLLWTIEKQFLTTYKKINPREEINRLNLIWKKARKVITNENLLADILSDSTKHIKWNKDLINSYIKKIIDKVTIDNPLITNILNTFEIQNLIINFDFSKKTLLNILRWLINSKKLQNIISLFIHELFDKNNLNIDNIQDFLKKILNSNNLPNIIDSIKYLIKDILMNQDILITKIANTIIKSMKKSGMSIGHNDEIIIQKLLNQFAKNLAISSLIDKVLNNSIKVLSEIKFESNNIFENIFYIIKNLVFSIFSNKNEKISWAKIVLYIDEIESLINNIDIFVLSDFINLIFRCSPMSFERGIYSFIFGNSKYKITDVFSIIGIGKAISTGKLFKLIKIIFKPLIRRFYSDLSNSEIFTDINEIKRNSLGYQAIWRTYTFLMKTLHFFVPKKFIFWNKFGLSVESFINKAIAKTIKEVIRNFSYLEKKYKSNLNLIGLINITKPINYYFSGFQIIKYKTIFGHRKIHSRSTKLNSYQYGRDHTLVYICWSNKYDWKYNKNKTFDEVLCEDLIKGYQEIKDY